jgi:inner membrane protein
MDNLAHTLLGAAMAKSRLGRASRFATATLLVGANLPDLDGVAGLASSGRASYLLHHRGWTHSFLGIAVGTVVLAAIVRWLERAFARRDASGAASARLAWRAHLVPAFFALSSHLLLDALNTYGVRPLLPLSGHRFFGDLVHIVDPWLWLLFGGAALLAGPRSRRGGVVWLALGAATTFLVYRSELTPVAVKRAWPFAIALLAALRLAKVGASSPRLLLGTFGALVLLYLGGLEACATVARRCAVPPPPPPPPPQTAGVAAARPAPWRFAMRAPTVADPFAWDLFFENDDWIVVEHVDTDGRVQGPWFVGPRRLDDPSVRAVAGTREAAAWRDFARLPWARVEPVGSQVDVVLADGRYDRGGAYGWCTLVVPLPGAPSVHWQSSSGR